jgi:uncharacterized membrane protein
MNPWCCASNIPCINTVWYVMGIDFWLALYMLPCICWLVYAARPERGNAGQASTIQLHRQADLDIIYICACNADALDAYVLSMLT